MRYKRHIQLAHIQFDGQCPMCDKILKNEKELSYHIWYHKAFSKKKFECDLCGRGFISKHKVMKHLEIVHKQHQHHACHICGKSFKFEEYLQLHLKRHEGQPSFQCEICAHRVEKSYKLRIHMKKHGIKMYECKICKKDLHLKYKLKEHLKTVHGVHEIEKLENFDYPCNFCDRTFKLRRLLRTHMENDHVQLGNG